MFDKFYLLEDELRPTLPNKSGIYVLGLYNDGEVEPIYVGKTKSNIRGRVINGHLKIINEKPDRFGDSIRSVLSNVDKGWYVSWIETNAGDVDEIEKEVIELFSGKLINKEHNRYRRIINEDKYNEQISREVALPKIIDYNLPTVSAVNYELLKREIDVFYWIVDQLEEEELVCNVKLTHGNRALFLPENGIQNVIKSSPGIRYGSYDHYNQLSPIQVQAKTFLKFLVVVIRNDQRLSKCLSLMTLHHPFTIEIAKEMTKGRFNCR